MKEKLLKKGVLIREQGDKVLLCTSVDDFEINLMPSRIVLMEYDLITGEIAIGFYGLTIGEEGSLFPRE